MECGKRGLNTTLRDGVLYADPGVETLLFANLTHCTPGSCGAECPWGAACTVETLAW